MTFDLKRLPAALGPPIHVEEEDSLCWRMKMKIFLSASAATLLMLPEQQPLTFSMLAVLLWAAETRSPAGLWLLTGSELFTSSLHLLLSLPPSDLSLSFFSLFVHPLVFPAADLFLPLFSRSSFSFSNLVFLCLMNKINFCF